MSNDGTATGKQMRTLSARLYLYDTGASHEEMGMGASSLSPVVAQATRRWSIFLSSARKNGT